MATTPTADYLDPQALAAIGALELRSRTVAEGMMTGMHRSPYQGASVEFAQHRQYTAGDDLRHLDWKVFGRSDKLYLKQYQKETNLEVVLCVDVSGSMGYGSKRKPAWRKYDHAATIAAAMTFLALLQQDRVELTLFAERARVATRMSNSKDHWKAVTDALTQAHPAQSADGNASARGGQSAGGEDVGTDMARMFDELVAKLRRRSLVVVISDFFDDVESLQRGMARLYHRRHDLLLMQVLDPAERQFPFRSPSEFVGMESDGKLALDPASLREAYLEALREHVETIRESARQFRFEHLLLDTGESVGPPLSQFLARRSALVNRALTR